MYGVSPQPAQAPEYSKSGSRNCVPLTSSLIVVAVGLGQVEEERVVLALRARAAAAAGSCRSPCASGSTCPWPGRPSTHRLQPVQSSGATWIVYFFPLNSAPLKSIDLKVAGRLAERVGRRRPWRGWRRAGRPARTCCTGCRSWRPRPGSRAAMLRFSHWRGAGGPGAVHREGAHRQQVALAGDHHRGDALARSRAPSRRRRAAASSWRRGARRDRRPRGGGPGSASTAAKLRWTTSAPFLP